MTRRTNGPLLGFEVADAGVIAALRVAALRVFVPAVAEAAEPAGATDRVFAAPAFDLDRPERRAAAPPGCAPRLVLAAARVAGALRLGAARGADCGDAAWAPEPRVELALGEPVGCEPVGVFPVVVGLTGFGSGGALADGVVMLGVLTDGTLTVPTVTGGVATEGTVTVGRLIVGVGALRVGVETLIVGTEASEDAVATSSAPQTIRAATTGRRMGARTGH